MTPDVQVVAQQIADRVECRILTNLWAMREDHVPEDQIAVYLDLERETVTSWHDRQDGLHAELVAWMQAWDTPHE